jgi:hypothetical protein
VLNNPAGALNNPTGVFNFHAGSPNKPKSP